jgi:hypothetical protein
LGHSSGGGASDWGSFRQDSIRKATTQRRHATRIEREAGFCSLSKEGPVCLADSTSAS